MEESNQFLEENATIYDTETEDEKLSEDIVCVYSGEAMNMQDVFQLSCVEDIEPVIVAGEQASGKTTLEVMMYRLFLEGENESFQFAGSYTMKGFWKRSKNFLKKSGAEIPEVSRTLRAEKKFLHLAVCRENSKKNHLVFADYAGELFDEPSCLEELGEFFGGLANVVVTLDGAKICHYKERKQIITHTRILLRQMQNVGILSKHTHLYIVCTKYDEIKKSEKRDAIIEFLEKSYKDLKEIFEEKVRKIDLVSLCAYEIYEKEEREKMENLLAGFTEKREEMEFTFKEEQIKIKRQMDKFKIRG